MKTILLLLSFTCFLLKGQDSQSKLNWNNMSINNPALSGVEAKSFSAIQYNNLWPSIPGAHYQFNCFSDYRIDKLSSGIGLNYTRLENSDNEYKNYNERFALNYAYHYEFSSNTKLSLGTAINFLNVSNTANRFNNQNISASSVDYSIAIAFSSADFNGGISLNNFSDNSPQELGYYLPYRNLNTFISYDFNITTKLTTKLLVNYIRGVVFNSSNVSALITYDEKVWIGAGLISFDEKYASFGIDIKSKYRLGYAYGSSISKLSNYSGGNHEFLIAFILN